MDQKPVPSKPFIFPVMKKAIEDLFAKSLITKEDIEAFQDRYWEQLVPNFSQALKLLDIHGVPRHNILWNINDRLLDAIRFNIETKESSDQKKCQKLWQKLIKTGKMNSIKDRHVNLIVDNQYLYDDAPLPVLRHIWIAHPYKFKDELDKLFTRYQLCWSESLLDALCLSITATATTTSDLIPLIYWPPRRRRRWPAMVRIVEMIGDGQSLYDKTVHILREAYLSAKQTAVEQSFGPIVSRETLSDVTTPPPKRSRRLNSSDLSLDEKQEFFGPTYFTSPAFLSQPSALNASLLSTIRFDLLMSLNEAKIDRLCVPDRIHHFVWGLDACVRNRRIDQRHASGLAYRLSSQQQRARKADSLADEQQRDSDAEIPEGSSKRGSSSNRPKANRGAGSSNSAKRLHPDEREPKDDSITGDKFTETELLERDIHMACRDPWVVYTVCTSLIRYAIKGLYEYKLPRDIPEISLLVNFLLWAHGNDFQLPSTQQLTSQYKELPNSKSVLKNATELGADRHSAQALVGHILPAIAQLQVLAWRAQVAEEIVALSNQIWPGSCSSPSPASSGVRRTSVPAFQDGRVEFDPPSVSLLKQISTASHSTTVAVPPDYFVHPIGYLLFQYHALFALEQGELAVLRALLKAAVNMVQQQARASRLAGRTAFGKFGPGSPPKSPPPMPGPQFGFRWRPEVLQALVLGITRLPISSPGFVDSGHPLSGAMNEANLDGRAESTHATSESTTSRDPNSTKAIPSTVDDSTTIGASGATEARVAPIVLVNRSELALLLKASLTLSSDVHLLCLAQLALLLPGPQAVGSNMILSAPESTVPESPTSTSEREKCVALLSRHISNSGESELDPVGSESVQQPASATPGPYKSNDSRVLLALDTLKKDLERAILPPSSCNLSIPKLSGPTMSGSFTPSPAGMTPQRGPPQVSTPSLSGHPSASFSGTTPRSPTMGPKTLRPGSVFARPDTRLGSTSSFFPSSHVLPMATPLTNPGLMGATPHGSNFGCSNNVPQTPRRPSTPPPEFRPSTPPHLGHS